MQQVWYVAYGSNLCRDRFLCYLRGGRPPGARRHYAGSRDPRDPADDVAVMIPGGLRFVEESRVWGGGLAVWDPHANTTVAARAYLITVEQFADVFAQETRTEPELELDLTAVRDTGWHVRGPGPYQTLASLGVRAGVAMLTFTSAQLEHLTDSPPSRRYLRYITAGLAESHGWNAEQSARYLSGFTACSV